MYTISSTRSFTGTPAPLTLEVATDIQETLERWTGVHFFIVPLTFDNLSLSPQESDG